MPRELKPCGTPAAYQRHLRRNEEACADCKAAQAQRTAIPTLIRRKADRELIRRHRPEYDQILAEQTALYEQEQEQKDLAWARVFAEAAGEVADA